VLLPGPENTSHKQICHCSPAAVFLIRFGVNALNSTPNIVAIVLVTVGSACCLALGTFAGTILALTALTPISAPARHMAIWVTWLLQTQRQKLQRAVSKQCGYASGRTSNAAASVQALPAASGLCKLSPWLAPAVCTSFAHE
jgi:hypothetical protein